MTQSARWLVGLSMAISALWCSSEGSVEESGRGSATVDAAQGGEVPGTDAAGMADASQRADAGADAAPSTAPPLSDRPTLSSAGGTCELGEVRTLATLEMQLTAASVALDARGGLVAWVGSGGELTLQPIDVSGSPAGEARTHAIEGAREVFALRRRIDGFRVFTFGGAKLTAIDVDATGAVVGEPRNGDIVACRPALEGFAGPPSMYPRPMRVDLSRHASYRVHWHRDELHLVCLDYRQMEFRRVEVTDDGVTASPREIARTGNVKEANVLDYWWLSDGENWVMVTSLFDEDLVDESGVLMRTPGWAPNRGMEALGGLLRFPPQIRGNIRSLRLVGETLELIQERRRGSFRFWRVSFRGEVIGEPTEVATESLPEGFDEYLDLSLEVEGSELRLARKDALGRTVGEAPVAIGPVEVRRARGVHIDPPADWGWTGRELVVVWVEREGDSRRVQSRSLSCPR